jgi:molybdopterin converting factor small subunit
VPRVEVYIYAMLRRYKPNLRPGQPVTANLAESATLADLLTAVGIPAEETKQTFVNGISRGLEWQLCDGDRVALFPPIAGG